MKRKLNTLTQDDRIVDLRPVNQLFVSRYRQAMRNGDKFPPLVIDQNDAIVCGYHRRDAYLAEYGEDHAVEVVKRTFSSEAERIEEAIRDNARHGNPMDGITRKRAVLMLTELGRDPEAIGRLLGISCKRVEEMAGMAVLVIGGKYGKRGKSEPVKRGLEHMAGRKVTEDQYEAHKKRDRGVPAAQSARQLIRWIESGWIEWSDESTFDAMMDLRAAIDANIPK